MSGDRLAHIEAAGNRASLLKRSGVAPHPYYVEPADVLALVEIAKAARALMEDVDEIMDEDLRLDALKQKIGAAFLGYGGAWNHEDEFRAALARLDSGAAEDARTSSEGGRNQEHLSSAKAAPSPDPEDSGAAEENA